MEDYTRRFEDVENRAETLHELEIGDSSWSPITSDLGSKLSSYPTPIDQPQRVSNASAHQQRYKESLQHQIADPWEQLWQRSHVPQGIVLPELVIRESPKEAPSRPEAAHVTQARKEVRADERTRALSPPISLGHYKRMGPSRISVIKNYVYPSGEDPEPFIPDPRELCTHPDCPITSFIGEKHYQGPYYYEKGAPNPRIDIKIFGASNPPMSISRAYDDCFVQDQVDTVSMENLDRVVPFAFFHGFLDDDVVARYKIGYVSDSDSLRAMRKQLLFKYKNPPKKKEPAD